MMSNNDDCQILSENPPDDALFHSCARERRCCSLPPGRGGTNWLLVFQKQLQKSLALLRWKFHTILSHQSHHTSRERIVIDLGGDLDDIAEKIGTELGIAPRSHVAQEIQNHEELFCCRFVLQILLHERRTCELVWRHTCIAHPGEHSPCFRCLGAAYSGIHDCVVCDGIGPHCCLAHLVEQLDRVINVLLLRETFQDCVERDHIYNRGGCEFSQQFQGSLELRSGNSCGQHNV